MQSIELIAQQPNPGAYLIGMAIGLLIGGTIGLMIAAVIFRAAVSLLNKMVEESVDEPNFGRSVLIVFVRFIANFAIGFVIGLVGAILSGGKMDPAAQLVINGIAAIMGIFVSGGIISAMLPTSYGKGLLISILEFAIVMCIVLVLVGVVFAVGGFAR